MITTFKETLTSVKDLRYGQQIIKKTVGQTFWYWLKYVLLAAIVAFVLSLAALTYFVPQIPQLAEKAVPDITIAIKDGKFTTDAKEPLILGDENFPIIINTKGKASDLDSYKTGVLVLENEIIAKDESQTRIVKFSEFDEDISLNKPTVVNWLKDHKIGLLIAGLVIAFIGELIFLSIFLIWKSVTFLLAALLLWVGALALKRKIQYEDSLKLIIYAAVPSLIVSFLFTFTGSDLGSLISLVVWVFFASSWLSRLPVANKSK